MSWLADWLYRKSRPLGRASGAVTDHVMTLTVGESSGSGACDLHCEGHCLPSFNDLRFTQPDGTTLLSYFIESISGATPNQLATIKIKFTPIGTSDTTFCMYYGNANALEYSNGGNTFRWFDDNERPSWTATKLADSQNSPEALVAIGSYLYQAEQKTPTRVHEINPSTGAATGEYFDFDAADSTHLAGMAWDGTYLWAIDYSTSKVHKINLTSSLSTHAAVIIGSFSVGANYGSIAFIKYDGATQMMITEYATSGAMLVVDYVAALADGTVTGNILRTFYQNADGNAIGRIQGLYSRAADNYENVLVNTQVYTAGHNSTNATYLRWYKWDDLINIAEDTLILSSTYFANARYFTNATYIGQQPAIYNGTLYICEETNNDLLTLAESNVALVNASWDVDAGSIFTASADFAYHGTYSAKLPVGDHTMNLHIAQGACRLDMRVYPVSYDEHLYIAVAEAADLTDRLTVGLHGNSYWEYWDGSWHTCGVNVTTGAWATISYIADNAGNIKLLVNETEAYSGSRIDNIQYLIYQLVAGYGAHAMYVDTAYTRQYLATEPAWSGSWSAEIIYGGDEMVSTTKIDEASWVANANYRAFLIF